MKKTTLLLFLFFLTIELQAQTFGLRQKIYGSAGQAYLRDMKITADSDYIMCGYASGSGYQKTNPGYGVYDYWIVKTGPSGRIKWDLTLGGIGDDEAYSITPAAGGKGYLVAGTSTSPPSGNKTTPAYGGMDIWVVKLDNAGNIEWQKTYGGAGDDGFYVTVDTTLDGGYVIGTSTASSVSGTKTSPLYGTSNFDAWVLKLDANGNVIWDKDYGGTDYDFFAQAKHTRDSGFIIGTSSSSGISGCKTEANRGTRSDEEGSKQDYWIIKVDKNGNQLWDKTLGTADPEDNLFSIIETADGGYVANGTVEIGVSGDKTSPAFGERDYWAVKVDVNGTKVWDKTFGGSFVEDLGFLEPTADGGFVIGGTSWSDISGTKTENTRGVEDYWLAKVDKNGNQQWDKTIGGSDFDECWAVCVAGKNQYILSGWSWSGVSGDKTLPAEGFGHYWIVGVNYRPNGSVSTKVIADDKTNKISVYPNPANNFINIQSSAKTTITLTSQSGRVILSKTISGTGQINTSNLPEGIYYIKGNLQSEPVKVIINH